MKRIVSLLIILSILFGVGFVDKKEIQPDTQVYVEIDENIIISNEPVRYLVEATAYYNPNNNKCADGTSPVEGVTVAGKREWLGKSVKIYEVVNKNEVGNLIGVYEFHDTGFGNDLDGDGIGSIQEGKCIDIFMNRYEDCISWGRRLVYIEFVEED